MGIDNHQATVEEKSVHRAAGEPHSTLPEGSCWLAHNWSGNVLSAVLAFMPESGDPTKIQY